MTNDQALADLAALRAGISEFCADLVASHAARAEAANEAAVLSDVLGTVRAEYKTLLVVLAAAAAAARADGADDLADHLDIERRASVDRALAAICPERDALN